jgi:hypothetical protein
MSYANRRVSNPVNCRIGPTLFGILNAPRLLLISAGRGRALQPQGPTRDRRVAEQMNKSCTDERMRACKPCLHQTTANEREDQNGSLARQH